MKNDYGIIKKSRGYVISSINDEAVYFIVSNLAGKIMRKCRADKVPTLVVSLVA